MSTPPHIVAGCPWCGDGTSLSIIGDGLGGVSLGCQQCGSRGPRVAIEGDFDAADAKAVASWSDRSPVAPETLQRVTRAVNLAALLNGGPPDASVEVSLRYGDLLKLIRVSRPSWTRAMPPAAAGLEAPVQLQRLLPR